MKKVFFALSLLTIVSCQSNAQKSEALKVDQNIIDYWSDGTAELNSYDLEQMRYGELRRGTHMQIFVAEDFLTKKQVKNESYKNKNSAWVLKRIETRQFLTGIYQYNMFTSAFTPFDVFHHPHSLKVSSSSQEWCGTTYAQLNYKDKSYDYQLHSYFEKEADDKTEIKNALTEEEILTKIRFGESHLPKGTFNIIPSQIVTRFLHLPLKSYKAKAVISKYQGQEFETKTKVYTLDIPDLKRTLKVFYTEDAPHTILGWDDSYMNPFGKDTITSTARLKKQLKEKYWQRNSNADQHLRLELGLD